MSTQDWHLSRIAQHVTGLSTLTRELQKQQRFLFLFRPETSDFNLPSLKAFSKFSFSQIRFQISCSLICPYLQMGLQGVAKAMNAPFPPFPWQLIPKSGWSDAIGRSSDNRFENVKCQIENWDAIENSKSIRSSVGWPFRSHSNLRPRWSERRRFRWEIFRVRASSWTEIDHWKQISCELIDKHI